MYSRLLRIVDDTIGSKQGKFVFLKPTNISAGLQIQGSAVFMGPVNSP